MSRPTRDSAAGRAYLDLQNRAPRERRPSAELVVLRSGEYAAYRSSLGMSGHDLPEDFAELVRVVAAFGDRVLTDRRASSTTYGV